MNKLVLDFEYDFDFTLFGVSSHVANYRLAWGINKLLDIDLERMDDVDLSFGKEKKRSFSFYRFDDEESYTTIHLVSNRSTNGYLIPESFDYEVLSQKQITQKKVVVSEGSQTFGVDQLAGYNNTNK